MQGTCRKFPQSSVQNQHFCEPREPAFLLPWKMNGAYHTHQDMLNGFNFVFATYNHKVSWGVGFLLLTFPVVRHPHSSPPDWLFCSPHAGTLGEGQNGLGGRRSHGLVDIYSIITSFPKAVFPGRMRNSPGSPIVGSVPVPLGQDYWTPHSAGPTSILCSSGECSSFGI